jgi:Rrf2 family iron-sulfur cluster assembly transcriptional regulator
MITRTGRYALRILGYLVDRPGQWIQGSQIAAGTGIPSNYLSKILNQLRKKGFVYSQKGWGGGFMLQERALRVPIAEVIDLFEGPLDEKKCIFGLRECDAAHPCPLHPQWESIQSHYREMLKKTKVGNLKSGF